MINRLLGRLTPRRIIAYLVMIVVAIYIVWYVVEALEGLNPNYQPYHARADSSSTNAGGAEIKGGAVIFDPTKNTPEAVPVK